MIRVLTDDFKRILEARRDELTREIAKRREGLAVDTASDPMDQVCNAAERDLAVRTVDELNTGLRLVQRSLSRIRDETYGVCDECGNDIPIIRLRAIPWSLLCVRCQENAEFLAFGREDGENSQLALAS